MKSKVKDKLVGIYAPGHYDHTSLLEQTQLAMGTKEENAEQLGVSVHAVHSYGSPSYHKRTSEKNGRRLYKL